MAGRSWPATIRSTFWRRLSLAILAPLAVLYLWPLQVVVWLPVTVAHVIAAAAIAAWDRFIWALTPDRNGRLFIAAFSMMWDDKYHEDEDGALDRAAAFARKFK